MKKHYLPYIEFYITNVCNLNCSNCRSFNNFSFKGHQRWEDFKDQYQAWAEILDIDMISILGGEPMLNPDFLQWLNGIALLWSGSNIVINTNGTQLDRWPELYGILKKYQGRISISIDRHDLRKKDELDRKIRAMMQSPINLIDNNLPDRFRGEPAKDFYQNLNDIYCKINPEYRSDSNNCDRIEWLKLTVTEKEKCLDEFNNNLEFWKYRSWRETYSIIKDSSWPDCPTTDSFSLLPDKIKNECIKIHQFSPEIWENNRWRYEYNSIKHADWPDCNLERDFHKLPKSVQNTCITKYNLAPGFYQENCLIYQDANNVLVKTTYSKPFSKSIFVSHAGKNKKTFHDSDPEKAVKSCVFAMCHHFAHGIMHKCPPMAPIKDFVSQFDVDLTEKQKSLIKNYTGARHTDSWEKIEKFLDNLKSKKSIPQCSLCPEDASNVRFVADVKKMDFYV
jgi:organic radical activating enzyme